MKRFVPYSFLLLSALILNQIIASAKQISPTESLRPFVVFFVVFGLLFIGVQHWVKEWHRTNFLVALIPLSVFVYEAIYRWVKREYLADSDRLGLLLIPLVALMYAALASPWLWKLVRKPAEVTRFFNLVFVILLGMQLPQLGAVIGPLLTPADTRILPTAIAPLRPPIHLQAGTRPDIYVMILDGYGRQDVLQEIYGYDNSEFLSGLQKRGFYVASDSHSNYTQTAYSIASLMNFDYIQPWQDSTDYVDYLLNPIKNNRAFDLLSEVGYKRVSFEGGTSYSQIQNSDVLDSGFLPLNKFETQLLTDTPLEPLSDVLHLGIPIPNYDTHRQRILNEFKTLQAIPTSIQGPKITYFHVLAPHPPFVFDEHGNPISPDRPYSILDGDEYQGSLKEYWNGYRQQVEFVNGKVLDTIDTLLAHSATPPVILIMGDHGPGSMFKWDPKVPGCLWERTHNLYALLLPNPPQPAPLYASITPVNTFRVIFNSYFGTHLPLLDDRTFLAAWQYPKSITNVTQTRDSKEYCTFEEN